MPLHFFAVTFTAAIVASLRRAFGFGMQCFRMLETVIVRTVSVTPRDPVVPGLTSSGGF